MGDAVGVSGKVATTLRPSRVRLVRLRAHTSQTTRPFCSD